MKIDRTGIIENFSEKRYEYWVVENEEVKVMASWISWDLPQEQINKWMEEMQLSGTSS
ncbi:hypothetical protein IQ283_10970 [Alkalihalobacillus hwajinpoensis]|uniref:hypothetical protein n=1 Tax=Guptibacillus hwajinpoensis TaxID=208199 RepID=UPI0018847BEF|nr:hypothetical protein [Pseudalkalibacillus hwajinpoensis]MBF0707115.1 hypothetical protein [Pseudalkalibacillus hwajinpoensis]